MRELVFIHGRSQQQKDSVELKKKWIDAWHKGLAKKSLDLPLPETAIRFPYYGDTLDQLVHGTPAQDAAAIVIRGNELDNARKAFVEAVLDEIRTELEIPDEEVHKALPPGSVATRGVLNWEWVQGLLKAIDRKVPGASAASVALATLDVYEYLTNPGIRKVIDDGVAAAISAGPETVVVAHSLGTVVAYNLLRIRGPEAGWKVPLFVTLGSPLAVKVIRKKISELAPIAYPHCAGAWFNAMDERDVVALYPLDKKHFSVSPPIENKTDVHNHTSNAHGILGYLDDAEIAQRIHAALTA